MPFVNFLFNELLTFKNIFLFFLISLSLYFFLVPLGIAKPRNLLKEVIKIGKFKRYIMLAVVLLVIIYALAEKWGGDLLILEFSVVTQIALIFIIFTLPIIIFLDDKIKLNKFSLIILILLIAILSTKLGSPISYYWMVEKNKFKKIENPTFLLTDLKQNNKWSLFANKHETEERLYTNLYKDLCDNLTKEGISCEEGIRCSKKLGLKVRWLKQAQKIKNDLNADFLYAIYSTETKPDGINKYSTNRFPSLFSNDVFAQNRDVEKPVIYNAFIIYENKNQLTISSDSLTDYKTDTDLSLPTSSDINFSSNNPDLLISYVVNFSIGVVNYEKKLFNKAISAFKQILDLRNQYNNEYLTTNDINLTEIYNYLGASYFRIDSLAQSVYVLKKAIEQKPQVAFSHVFLARALYKMTRDIDSALKHLDTAITIDPKYACAYYSKGIIYYYEEDYSNSIKSYNKAIAINPKFLKSKHNLAVTFTKLKPPKLDEAERILKEVIHSDKDYALAYYNLICVYLNQNEIDLALKLLQDKSNLLAKKLPEHGNKSPLDYANTDPDFDPIRNHPIYLKILSSIQ